ncbi:MAG: hypothetical protein Q8R33_24505 [Burkholderiales bacterium]|nr:hypothetical protein [Burkholderiales bacterium]
METAAQPFNACNLAEPPPVLSRDGARDEDAHWARAHRDERYYKAGLDYEDYAPAYCVGYIGHAQYGGRFEDAESSLCSNWERIKGDSRLPLEEALLAMRAAWDRMARQSRPRTRRPSIGVGLIRRHLGIPSFKQGMRLTR